MDWKALLEETNDQTAPVRAAIPDTARGFGALARAATAEGALDTRTKELIALAIGVAKQCDACIGFHVKAAIRAGASREDVAEAVGVCVLMGGGPSLMYGAKALDAYDALAS